RPRESRPGSLGDAVEDDGHVGQPRHLPAHLGRPRPPVRHRRRRDQLTMKRETTRAALRSAARRRAARADGFTLIEMLLVLSIMGVLMGISIGAFRPSGPAQALARNAVVDALRMARQFAQQENATAFVRVEGATGETPTVTAVGKKTVGTWHLEGDDLEGF